MAFVAIANFTQRSYELGYAFKFLRMGLLLLTALFNVWGFALGSICILILLLALRKPIEKAEGTEAEKSGEEVGA